MKKLFMCGMLLGPCQCLAFPVIAAASSGTGRIRRAAQGYGIDPETLSPRREYPWPDGNAGHFGRQDAGCERSPYYVTASTIGSVSMKAVVPPIPLSTGINLLAFGYMVAESSRGLERPGPRPIRCLVLLWG